MGRALKEFDQFPARLHPSFGPYAALMRWDRRYDDGDTIAVLLDFGFSLHQFSKVRFRGIDAPELRRADSREAAVAAREFLFTILPYDCPVRLYTAKDTDQWGRYVADVIYLDEVGDLRCANVDMVEAGHAILREEWGWFDTIATCDLLDIPVEGHP